MSSNNNNNKNSLGKDILKLVIVWAPLLFIIIGGLVWKNGGFNGSIMEGLFPALFFGFIVAFFVLIIASNLFEERPAIWWVAGILFGIITVVLELNGARTATVILIAICGTVLFLLKLVKWIAKK